MQRGAIEPVNRMDTSPVCSDIAFLSVLVN